MDTQEVYRGFAIIYLLTPFGVNAVAKNNGKRVSGLVAFGSYQDEARRRLRNRIDNLLTDNGE